MMPSLLSSVLQLSGVQRLSCSRAPPPPSPSLPRAPLSAAATKTPPIDRSGVAQRPRGAPTRIGSTGSMSRLLLTHSSTRSLSAAALRAPALGALHTPPPSAPMAPETLTLPINPRCSGVHRATRRSTSAPLRCTAKTRSCRTRVVDHQHRHGLRWRMLLLLPWPPPAPQSCAAHGLCSCSAP